MEVTKIDVQQLILTIHELVKENFSNKIELNDLVFTVLDHAGDEISPYHIHNHDVYPYILWTCYYKVMSSNNIEGEVEVFEKLEYDYEWEDPMSIIEQLKAKLSFPGTENLKLEEIKFTNITKQDNRVIENTCEVYGKPSGFAVLTYV